MKITETQLKRIIQEESAQILLEAGVLDKIKDFLKTVPGEAEKLGKKIKAQLMTFPELYPIFQKVINKEKLSTVDKKALSTALADAFKGGAFAATLITGAGALAFVGPIASVVILALEEMGVDWRPSKFSKERWRDVEGEKPEHVGITADMGGGRLAYAKGGK